jgi:hypothetical protein
MTKEDLSLSRISLSSKDMERDLTLMLLRQLRKT